MFSNIKIKSSLGNLRLLYYIKIESAMVVWYKVFSGVLAIVTVLRGVNGDEMSLVFWGEECVAFWKRKNAVESLTQKITFWGQKCSAFDFLNKP